MSQDHRRVCPVERAGALDNSLRRLLQNPRKILGPYLREGMTALDIGCGPGFFTIPMAQLVGRTGRVIAVDLQEGMLARLRGKIAGTELEPRIVLHKCDETRLGLLESVDFALLFYMVHEIPDKDRFFNELARIVRPAGRVLVVEPPFHVSQSAFAASLAKAETAGFIRTPGPGVFLSKTAILEQS
jgi:ubiquinone/menaquinone biosynthesis C-methylase UbiE